MPKSKSEKQHQAEERQIAYSKLSVKEKLALLDNKFGKGVGCKKQRERLTKLLVEEKKK